MTLSKFVHFLVTDAEQLSEQYEAEKNQLEKNDTFTQVIPGIWQLQDLLD